MLTIHHTAELRATIKQWRQKNLKVALVPTMGNLHAGHLSLVQQAGTLADRVVVTIFVNPTQFVAGEDFDRYPRTLPEDAAKLAEIGTDIIFAPEVEEVYPPSPGESTIVAVPALDGFLCGASRPGHFTGVATIVTKLFNLVQPDLAIFGEKDYQQLLVIKRFTRDLCIPVEIIHGALVREEDGLAMSSRNMYLSEKERKIAPEMYRLLLQAAKQLRQGEQYDSVEKAMMQSLADIGFEPEYVAVRRAEDLTVPLPEDPDLRILAAARLVDTRLIDNIALQDTVE